MKDFFVCQVLEIGLVQSGVNQVDIYDEQFYIIGFDFVEVDVDVDEDLDGFEVVILKVKGVNIVGVFKYDFGLFYGVCYLIK